MQILYSKRYLLQKKSIELDSSYLLFKKTNILGFGLKTERINISDILEVKITYYKTMGGTSTMGRGIGGRSHLWCVFKIISSNGVYNFDLSEDNTYKQTIGEIVKDSLEKTKLRGKISLNNKINEVSYK